MCSFCIGRPNVSEISTDSFVFVDFLVLVIYLLYISVAFVGRVPLFKHLFFVLSRVPATVTIATRDRMPAVACDWLD